MSFARLLIAVALATAAGLAVHGDGRPDPRTAPPVDACLASRIRIPRP